MSIGWRRFLQTNDSPLENLVGDVSDGFSLKNLIANWDQFVITILVIAIAYIGIKLLFKKKGGVDSKDRSMVRQIWLTIVVIIGIFAALLALPIPDSLRGQLTSLFGIVISAALAISSATFVGNALGGIMLKIIGNFKNGDFISVGDHFGRVTETGLFHVEIQTEDRNLTTLPNLYIASHPHKVTRNSGTIVKSTVSLGYDVQRAKIEATLKEAALACGLKDPFVLITSLGDFSVVYVLHGLLDKPIKLITATSKLNACVLDHLHEAGIEIVSPNFMNQRQVGETVFIPRKARKKEAEASQGDDAESVIFDKAEQATSVEQLKEQIAEIEKRIAQYQEDLKTCTEEQKELLTNRETRYKELLTRLQEKLATKVKELDEDQ